MITVKRTRFSDEFTGGELHVGGVFFCYTCEDTIREVKVAGETAIPRGVYLMDLTHSARFNRVLPELFDVPNFTKIRIHAGNTKKDTEGCILVGLTELPNGVGNSRAAMAKLMPVLQSALKRGKVWVEVKSA